MIPPMWRSPLAGVFAFSAGAITSMYYSPEPVLNSTTVSDGLRNFPASSFL